MKTARRRVWVALALFAGGLAAVLVYRSEPVRSWQVRRAVNEFFATVAAVEPRSSELPANVPADLTIAFSDSEGMIRAYDDIRISLTGTTYTQVFTNRSGKIIERTHELGLTSDQVSAIYHLLRDMGFDNIKVKPRLGKVHDSGATSITMGYRDAAGIGRSTSVAYYWNTDTFADDDLTAWRTLVDLFKRMMSVYAK